MGARTEIDSAYRRYLDACNARRLDEVASGLAPSIVVNGQNRSRQDYLGDLTQLWVAFPDDQWSIRQVVIELPWLAARLFDHGTRSGSFGRAPGDGASVATVEFAMYRFDHDIKTSQVWVTADNERLML